MPELPEVETIRRELQAAVLGKKITGVVIHSPRVIREPGVAEFSRLLKNQVIKEVLRKGKLLIFELSGGKSLAIHLKMTGQLIFPGNGKDGRVSFRFSDGKYLDFKDQRLFAELKVVDNWREMKFVRGLGPEPFDLKPDEFVKMLSRRKTRIKPLLLDQTFVAGIGNLYAAEALFRARIDPRRRADSLSLIEAKGLLHQIVTTLKNAIKYRGSSVDQYVKLDGKPGGYVKYHRVYDRLGKPCPACRTPIKRIALGGRGTYFCPKCQK